MDKFPETLYGTEDDFKVLVIQAKSYSYDYVAIYNNGVLNHYKRVRDRKDKKDCGCNGAKKW